MKKAELKKHCENIADLHSALLEETMSGSKGIFTALSIREVLKDEIQPRLISLMGCLDD